MKHPHDEVIRAYLDGKKVQFRLGSGWHDCEAMETYNWRMPEFLASQDWRIKPEVKKVKYRLYLYRDWENKFYVITAHPAEYDWAQEQRGFVKWLGPEQEYVVEEAD